MFPHVVPEDGFDPRALILLPVLRGDDDAPPDMIFFGLFNHGKHSLRRDDDDGEI